MEGGAKKELKVTRRGRRKMGRWWTSKARRVRGDFSEKLHGVS